MFRNLSTSTKLLLLCGIFVLSLAVTMYSLVSEKQIAIQFTRKEIIGSRYIAALRPVLSVLDDGDRGEFLAAYGAALRTAYPRQPYGTVFPFRRTFAVGRAGDQAPA